MRRYLDKCGIWDGVRRALGGEYASTARVRVEPEAPDVASLTARPLTSYDPYFIQIEFDAIQSERVLGKAVEI